MVNKLANLFYIYFFSVFFLAGSAFAKDIRQIVTSDFGGDSERFYREFANAPVIVHGVFAGNDFIQSLTLSQIEESFKARTVSGYDRKNDAKGRIREEIPGDLFFADLRGGASHYYVFDHAVSDSSLAGKVSVPAFLEQNWLTDEYSLNLTLSGKGSFTPLHEDGSGQQAWMYLVQGVKHWTLYPPHCRPLIWDSLFKDFYNPRKSDPSRYPFSQCAEADQVTAVLRAGELIFIPPGWAHQVETTQDSIGIGGNILNEFQALASIETGLNEKAHALRHDFDLLFVVHDKRNQWTTVYGKSQITQAIQLAEEWLVHVRNKSDGLLPRIAGTGPEARPGEPIL
jgi:hypothetical protein